MAFNSKTSHERNCEGLRGFHLETSFLRRTQQFRCSVRHTIQTELQKISLAKVLQVSLNWSEVWERWDSKGPACFFHLLLRNYCKEEKIVTWYQHATGERKDAFCAVQYFWRIQNTNQAAFSDLWGQWFVLMLWNMQLDRINEEWHWSY